MSNRARSLVSCRPFALLSLVLALLFIAPLAAQASGEEPEPVSEEETVDFSDSLDDVVIGDGDAFRVYCVYTIVSTNGNCGRFAAGDRLCVNCPTNNYCPLAPQKVGNFRYLDANGKVICTGTWTRWYDLQNERACIACNTGHTGFKFVN